MKWVHNLFLQEYIEKFESYRNIKLCTQMVTLKFCKIVIKNDNEWNEYIIFFLQEYIERFESYKNIRLCTQMVFLKICEIVIKNDNK
jgi:hypothetical protein